MSRFIVYAYCYFENDGEPYTAEQIIGDFDDIVTANTQVEELLSGDTFDKIFAKKWGIVLGSVLYVDIVEIKDGKWGIPVVRDHYIPDRWGKWYRKLHIDNNGNKTVVER